ncbi:hypothetical protein D3C87_1365680 [compost metagenome]
MTVQAEFLAETGHNVGMSSPASANRSSARQTRKAAAASWLVEALSSSGCTDICVLQGQVCAVKQFNYTTAVVVGLDDVGYQRRYCYEHRADAQAALAAWDGCEHPSGPWIKCKGAGIDLLNPDFR